MAASERVDMGNSVSQTDWRQRLGYGGVDGTGRPGGCFGDEAVEEGL